VIEMRRLWLPFLAVALLGATAALEGSAAPPPKVYRVDFLFTSVGGKRPPNILESRRAGKGKLYLDTGPWANHAAPATATGKIVLDWDLIVPTPETVRMELAVTGGRVVFGLHEPFEAALDVKVTKSASTRGTPLECGVGETGQAWIADGAARKDEVAIRIGRCHIEQGESALEGKNSRVKVAIVGRCLVGQPNKPTQAGKPFCVTPLAETVTLSPGKVVPLKTDFDGKTRYTVEVSGVVSTTYGDGTPAVTVDPFHSWYGADCEKANPGVYFQIKDATGRMLGVSGSPRPACSPDHRYQVVVNKSPSGWYLEGKSTAWITVSPPAGGKAAGSFTLRITEGEPPVS
jgi:hypothetical protein